MATQAEITDFELSRYVMSLTQLAGRLQKDRATAEKLYNGIRNLPEATRMSESYTTTISKMSPQVIVHGEHGHLSDSQIVAKVRTALLAGVRSAWLWHQLGGRKWHLILHKNRYIASAASQLAVNGINSGP